jgi:hypothetical protein
MSEIARKYRRGGVVRLDGRSREARLMRTVRAELTAHVGGSPSATQRALIERAAWLSLHVAKIEARTAEGGGFSEADSRQYLAWSNSLTRTLRALGIEGAPQSAPSPANRLQAYLATKAAQPAGAAA